MLDKKKFKKPNIKLKQFQNRKSIDPNDMKLHFNGLFDIKETIFVRAVLNKNAEGCMTKKKLKKFTRLDMTAYK